ncbi:MAG: hypothetical protein QHH14_10200 [Clostridiales bacterium]|nr:hypothetical protein [Clostridiales bacterium]
MRFYRGAQPPREYFGVIRSSPNEIEFQIRVEFAESHLYHLVLDGEVPIAEGWFPTVRLGATNAYSVTMKAKKGITFIPGKTYRLCIGRTSPDAVLVYSNSYNCLVDHEFILPEK